MKIAHCIRNVLAAAMVAGISATFAGERNPDKPLAVASIGVDDTAKVNGGTQVVQSAATKVAKAGSRHSQRTVNTDEGLVYPSIPQLRKKGRGVPFPGSRDITSPEAEIAANTYLIGSVTHVRRKQITEMSLSDREVFLDALASVQEASTVVARMNRCLKNKGLGGLSETSEPLKLFYEDKNGVLSIMCFADKGTLSLQRTGSETQRAKQLYFDKNGRSVPSKQFGELKRLYRYHKNKNTVCVHTINEGTVAVDLNQEMTSPDLTFTYRAPNGTQYQCLKSSVFVVDTDETHTAYLGAMKELHQAKIVEKAKAYAQPKLKDPKSFTLRRVEERSYKEDTLWIVYFTADNRRLRVGVIETTSGKGPKEKRLFNVVPKNEMPSVMESSTLR